MVMRTSRLLAALAAVALIGASGAAAENPEAPLPAWPPAPEKARVEFVRSFSCAEDLGIQKGFFARLKDFIFGEENSRLVRPMAVVADGSAIFVADPGVRGVHRFDTASGDYALITGPEDAPLPSPVGLARGVGGEIYIADSALARVFVVRAGDKHATPLDLGATLRQPTGIAFDAVANRLFVADTAAHRIEVFERDGKHVAQIGTRGTGDGEFNFPTYLWLTSAGRLYVTDSLNFRIEAFDPQGRFVAKFGRQGSGTGEAARPKGVAADRYGHVYVVDALFHAIQIFDESGRLLLPVGQIGQQPGEFWLPTGLFIDPDSDLIYVADSYNRRIQVLHYVGGPG
jgi:DNA-binding beta-propeller fold protein YncE